MFFKKKDELLFSSTDTAIYETSEKTIEQIQSISFSKAKNKHAFIINFIFIN